MHDRWSLGILIGLPVFFIIVVVLIAWVSFFTYVSVRENDDEAFSLSAGGALALVVALVVAGFSYFPYSKEYHQWQHHGGEIERISSRVFTSGSGDSRAVSQRFVVSFKNDPGQWSCDDTRCSLLSVGDTLDVSCKRHYQWSGTPGYDCNYVKSDLGTK